MVELLQNDGAAVENRAEDNIPDVLLIDGVATLRSLEHGQLQPLTRLSATKFVFTTSLIPCMRAVLERGTITKKEAELFDEAIQKHLSDALLEQLKSEDIAVLERLLLPFVEGKSQAADRCQVQEPSSVGELLHEALATLESSKRVTRPMEQHLKIAVLVFQQMIVPAFEHILASGEVAKHDAALINEIIQHHVDDALLDAIGPQAVEVIEKLLLPFAADTNPMESQQKDVAKLFADAVVMLGTTIGSGLDDTERLSLAKFAFRDLVMPGIEQALQNGQLSAAASEDLRYILGQHVNSDLLDAMTPHSVKLIETILTSPFFSMSDEAGTQHPSEEKLVEHYVGDVEAQLHEAMIRLRDVDISSENSAYLSYKVFQDIVLEAIRQLTKDTEASENLAALTGAIFSNHCSVEVVNLFDEKTKAELKDFFGRPHMRGHIDEQLLLHVA
ncbi:MAG: hypothetical protein ACON5C_01575 [Alphaproteobacteria bacterium]